MIALGVETFGSPFSPEDPFMLRQSWNKHSAGEGRDEFMALPHTRWEAFAHRQLALGFSTAVEVHPLVVRKLRKGS